MGKVFDYDELTMIADLAKKHNVLVISDEVYEWLVYEPTKHIRMGNLILCNKPIFYKIVKIFIMLIIWYIGNIYTIY